MGEKIITINKTAKVQIPRCPDFIKIDGQSVSIGELNEKQLKFIAKQWTINLLALSEIKRMTPLKSKQAKRN